MTLLCLATKKGLSVLENVDPQFYKTLVVTSFEERNVADSYFEQIAKLCERKGIVFIEWKKIKDLVAFLKEQQISQILCIGWGHLIEQAAVDNVNGNVVVAHDSLLPRHRGFNPLVTAMLLRDSHAGVTFLKASQSVDAGPILAQYKFPIFETDTIADLIDRTLPFYVNGAQAFLSGQFENEMAQDEAQASFSLWRDDEDYKIDWNWDAEEIHTRVRALGRPYLGARTFLAAKKVVIHQAEVIQDENFSIRQPGKVVRLSAKGEPEVVCGRGILRICEATLEDTSLLPLRRLRVRFG